MISRMLVWYGQNLRSPTPQPPNPQSANLQPAQIPVYCVSPALGHLLRRSTAVVRAGRKQDKDWYLFESTGLLDRLAFRRDKKSWFELSFKADRMTVDLMVQVVWLTFKSRTYPIQFTIGFKL
jgi:hypothetical protein